MYTSYRKHLRTQFFFTWNKMLGVMWESCTLYHYYVLLITGNTLSCEIMQNL